MRRHATRKARTPPSSTIHSIDLSSTLPSGVRLSTPGVRPRLLLLKVSKLFLFLPVFSVVVEFPEGKAVFFRITTEFSLIALLIHWAWGDQEGQLAARAAKLVRSPLFLAVTAFVFFFVLSSFFAYDTHSSFWSDFERDEGAFQMLHYYLFFVLCSLLLTTENDWKWMLRMSLGAAVLVVLYGVAAAVPLPGFIWIEGIPAEFGIWKRLVTSGFRFQGSLGNASYAGSYLMFSILYALYLWVRVPRPTAWQTILGYSTAVLFLLGFLWLSGTRAGFVGLLAAMAGFALFVILRAGRASRSAVAVLCAVAIVVLVVFLIRRPAVGISGSRILNFSLGESSVQLRLWAWKAAWRGFLERPLLGWGPENFPAVFDKYADSRSFTPGTTFQTTWFFDRAHSIVFDYLAETGIITFLAYCSIPVTLYATLWRKVRSGAGASGRTTSLNVVSQQGLLFATPIGYLTQGLVMFDAFPIYISYFTFVALTIYTLGNGSGHETE
jgi:O-antigen ligase